MELKPRLKSQLVRAREFSEKLVSDFKTPQEWTHQLFPGSNHALWFIGHMAFVDNSLVGLLAPEKKQEFPYNKLFGMNSEPSNNPADYPPPEEVLARLRDRRQQLLETLDAMSEADLAAPVRPGGPSFLTDNASAFELAIWHECMHAGQITMARRALGHRPLMGGRPKPPEA